MPRFENGGSGTRGSRSALLRATSQFRGLLREAQEASEGFVYGLAGRKCLCDVWVQKPQIEALLIGCVVLPVIKVWIAERLERKVS